MLPYARIRRSLPWLAAAAAFAVPSAPAHAAVAWPDGVAVVGYQSRAALRDALRREPARVVRMLPRLRVAEVRPRGDVARFARTLRGLPGIAYVERVAPRRRAVDPALVPPPGGGSYEWQWSAVQEDGVPAAALRAARGVTIAVVDTGADLTAPDLAAKQPAAWNVLSDTEVVVDSVGHGTFVSALAAGSVTNEEGIAGFGGDAKLAVVQASAGGGEFSDLDEASGIVWAVDHGARIVNLSLSGTETSSTERAALDYAASHGVLIVAAAGNDFDDGNPIEYPAALLQPLGSDGKGGTGLAVAASTADGRRAGFSSTGSYISLAAPGAAVFSALPAAVSNPAFLPVTLAGSRAGAYGVASGTSFAAPQVAGAAALVWGADPLLTAAQVADILKRTASGNGAWNPELGYGVLDVAAAVAAAAGGKVASPTVRLTGRRDAAGRARLSWTGRGAASYRVSVVQDGGAPRVLLASTKKTSASFALTFGHSYSFTVAALDANGAQQAVSDPYLVTLGQARSALALVATRHAGEGPLRVALSARLQASPRAVSSAGRTILLQAFEGGTWQQASATVTDGSGRAAWSFTLAAGTYRLRAKLTRTDDIAGTVSRALIIRVR